MIHAKDWILLGLMLAAMAVSFVWPQTGRPFQPYPAYFMMGLLFLSFLSISLRSISRTARDHGMRLLGWLFIKLVMLPIALFFLTRAFFPQYALTALLLAGISTGVVAPFFSTMLRANTPMVVLMVTASSVLVPLTLPSLVRLLAGQTLNISFAAMARILAQVILVPLVAAELLRSASPSLTERIASRRYPASLVLCVVIILGVFSKYSEFMHKNPTIILDALLASMILAALLFGAGILLSFRQEISNQLAVVISIGLMNNILVVVFGSECFSPLEPLVAILYCIPFFGSLVFLRAYSGFILHHHPACAQGHDFSR